MRSAKGVFIIPGSAAANTTAGAPQAAGVLLMNNNGRWSSPAFFSVSGATTSNQNALNNGANNGANNGQIALFIMSNRAMREFSGGTASLNRRRLNIVNYAPGSQLTHEANTDVVVWSANPPNTNILAGITRIRTNAAFDQAVYGTRNEHQIVAGRAPLTNQLADNLSNQTPAPQAANQIGMGTTYKTSRPG
jgi:hypothetical protein